VKSIVLNTVMQFIVFLYLLDNETSWMILLSVGIGLLIEIWKLRKAVDMEVQALIYTCHRTELHVGLLVERHCALDQTA